MYTSNLSVSSDPATSLNDIGRLSNPTFLKLNTQAVSPVHALKENDDAVKVALRLKSFLASDSKTITFIGQGPRHNSHQACLQVARSLTLFEGYDKVLLIDADFENPQIHSETNLLLSPGLYELLESNEPLDPTFRSTVSPGLHVLSAGRLNNARSARILPKKFNALHEKFRQLFSVVFISGPDLFNSYNAEYLASLSDAVVLVIQSGYISKTKLRETNQIIKRAGSESLGVIVSNV